MKLIVLTAILVAAGCAPGGLPDGADGGAPTTGIYRVTQRTTGNCSPAALDGSGSGYVVSDRPPVLMLSLSTETFGAPAAGLPGFGSSLEVFQIRNGSLPHDFDYCNAQMHQLFTVEQQTIDHVRLRRDDTLSGVATANSICLPNALPSGDCTQSSVIDYQLTEPCPQSCIQTDPPTDLTSPLMLRCSC